MRWHLVRKYWKRWNLRRADAGDGSALDRLYLIDDPWQLNRPEEHFRFQETVRIIRQRLGSHFGRILEVGCGEGLQTQYLAPLADCIIGLDPSPRALERARAKGIPNASFRVGDLASAPKYLQEKFDLVTACEVLYYMDNLDQAYEILKSVGRIAIVTYYSGRFEQLDGYFADKEVNSEVICVDQNQWKAVFWSDNTR